MSIFDIPDGIEIPPPSLSLSLFRYVPPPQDRERRHEIISLRTRFNLSIKPNSFGLFNVEASMREERAAIDRRRAEFRAKVDGVQAAVLRAELETMVEGDA